jgi:hypothetical protein
MKQYSVALALFILIAGLCATPAFAQETGTVKGVCKDLEGKPIAGAQVEYRQKVRHKNQQQGRILFFGDDARQVLGHAQQRR